MAADRVCGKRVKVLLLVLIEKMERHGDPQLDPVVRSALSGICVVTPTGSHGGADLCRPERTAAGLLRGQPGGAL